MVDSNEYVYTLRMISDLNNIGWDMFKLSIAHNNITGNQEYTYLICSQNYELKNLNEVLEFMDAELYETSYRHKKIQYKLIIKNKEKEKQLYHDELEYMDRSNNVH